MNTVTVMVRVKLNGGYPYLPAVINGNGRIKPGVALVGGAETKVEGSYYLRFTERGKRRMVCVGEDAAEAAVTAKKMEMAFKAQALGVAVQTPVAAMPSNRIKLADAIAEYKAEIKDHKAQKTYVAYAYALDLFVKGCNKTYVDEVGRGCIMAFAAALKKDGLSERTVFNRFGFVYTFLKRYGKAGIVGKNDWPKYEEVEAEIYSEDDYRKMLDACETHKERTLILFAAGTGFRHGEISHAEVGDVDFGEKTIQTRSKPELGFSTKDHEQRIVPVSDLLMAAVTKHANMCNGTLFFGTSEGKPDTHLDRIVKRVAKRANVTIPKKPMHAFRALYATRLVRQGVDIYTVQRLLGHSDIETTMGYLRAVKRNDPKLREQINAAAA